MKQKILKYLTPILIALLVLIIGIFLIANFATLGNLATIGNLLTFNRPIGTTLTTITEDTLVSDLGTILPVNFNALNAGKIEVSSSSVASITTLSNLVTVGTLTSGALGSGFTIIGVAQGGTGSSTLSVNQILLGNSASGVKVVAGYGTTGQLLTSNGAGNAPYWASPSVDVSVDYRWTGDHIFTASSTFYEMSFTNSGLATTTITKTEIDKLVGGATTDAASIHYHASDCIGGFGYMLENTVAAQVISHGLGVAPTLIEMTAITGGGAETMSQSFGIATSTSANNCTYYAHGNADANSVVAQSTSTIITLTNTSNTVSAAASISAISATTFTLNWTTNGTTGGNRFYTYRVCK